MYELCGTPADNHLSVVLYGVASELSRIISSTSVLQTFLPQIGSSSNTHNIIQQANKSVSSHLNETN